MTLENIKRNLRRLKKWELSVRYPGQSPAPHHKLVWDDFFSTKESESQTVLYPIPLLLVMDREAIKRVFEEYYTAVYFQIYRVKGYIDDHLFDPLLLQRMGLDADSSFQEIKARFRQLAKTHHPDVGGRHEDFVALMDTYRKLFEQQALHSQKKK